jgi:hypothetical protein
MRRGGFDAAQKMPIKKRTMTAITIARRLPQVIVIHLFFKFLRETIVATK